MTVFTEGEVRVFDREELCVKEIWVDERTVILDNLITQEGKEGLAQFTALHEAGHLLLHSGDYAEVDEHANFLESDKSFLYATAEVGFKDDIATKVEVWSGNRATDAVIEGMTTKSDVYGTEVTAGYFITDKNSQGISNSVWFAAFKLNGFSYYVELGGVESNSDAMKAEVTDLIGKLIKGGAPDLSKVKA